MRSELKEAIGRIHSNDYRKLASSETKLKRIKRANALQKLTGWDSISRRTGLRTPKALFLLAGFGVIIFLLVVGIHYFNKFSLVIVEVEQNKSMVDNELKRRASLIPNLLLVSAEYSVHEKVLYNFVSEMRGQLGVREGEAGALDKSFPLSELMSSLLAIAEEYPDLKATQSFELLMNDWAETENRIAEARGDYIQSIRKLNTLCTTFPSNVYGFLFGIKRYDPFAFDETDVSGMDLSEVYTKYRDLSKDAGKNLDAATGNTRAEKPEPGFDERLAGSTEETP